MKSFDVLVFGAGPAGSSVAHFLMQKGCTVAISDIADFSAFRLGESLPPQALPAMQQFPIGPDFFQQHSPNFSNLSAWGSAELQETNFFFHPNGNGWHLNRTLFDRQLCELAQSAGAEIWLNAQHQFIEQDEKMKWICSFIANGEKVTIKTRFIVDATGRNSWFAKKRGAQRLNTDHLIGIVETGISNDASNGYTLVETVEDGWWYSADLPDGKLILYLMTDADIYKKNFRKNKDWYAHQLSTTTHTQKRIRQSGAKNTNIVSANSYIMNCRSGANWLAIGDAAMAFDPLTSAGIHKALNDGERAAYAVHLHLQGNHTVLADFDRQCAARFQRYLAERKQIYEMERRWKGALFWERRGI